MSTAIAAAKWYAAQAARADLSVPSTDSRFAGYWPRPAVWLAGVVANCSVRSERGHAW